MSSYNLSWWVVLAIVAIILSAVLIAPKNVLHEKSFADNANVIYFDKNDTIYERDNLGSLLNHFSDSSVVSIKYKTIEAYRCGRGIFINKIH